MERKYELLAKEIVEADGREIECYRIRALKDIPRYNVKEGDLGGLVENEANLSHLGDCWVDEDSAVFDTARVSGDAYVTLESYIFGNARVFDNARIVDGYINENAIVCGHAYIGEMVSVKGNAVISGHAYLLGDVWVGNDSVITGNAHLGDGTDIGYFPDKCEECPLRYDCCETLQRERGNYFDEDDLECMLDK